MASKNNNSEQSKADVILQREEEVMRQQSELKQKADQILTQTGTAKDEILQKITREFTYSSKQNSQIYEGLKEEIAAKSKDFSYIYTQVESAYQKLSSELTQTAEGISSQVSQAVAQQFGTLADDMMAKVSAELAYMSAQITSVFDKLDKNVDARIAALEEKIDSLPKAVADELAARAAADADADAEVTEVEEEPEEQAPIINYEELSAIVAEKLEEVIKAHEPDYDTLAQDIADRVPPQEALSEEQIAAHVAEIANLPDALNVDYEELSDLIVAKLNEQQEEPVEETAEEIAVVEEPAEEVAEEPEYVVDYDTIADKVAEKLQIPAAPVKDDAAEIDYDYLVEQIIAKLPAPAEPQTIDTQALAEEIAQKVTALTNNDFAIVVDDEGCKTLSDAVAEKVAEKLAAADEPAPAIDSEELASIIADKIQVADEDAIADKTAAAVSNYIPELDADEIAEKVANIIIPALPAAPEAAPAPEIDYDEIAGKIASLVIPELPAASESAEVNYEEIADKVAGMIIPSIPAAPEVNYDLLCDRLTVLISEAQSQLDYDIVLDGEGIHMLADAITEELSASSVAGFDEVHAKLDSVTGMIADQSAARDGKFDEVHAKLDSIIYKEDEASQKAEAVYVEADAAKKGVQAVKEDTVQIISMLGDGAVVVIKTEDDETAAADAQLAEDIAEEEPAEEVAEEAAEEPVAQVAEESAEEAAEETVEEAAEEAPAEEAAEEVAEAPAEETPAEEHFEDEDLVTVSDLVDDEILDGDDSIAELIADEETEGKGGVDFANMMKYNRSFIARIIQGSDDVKRYYGQIKNAMLSYKKVNSSIAWGAERFNKGRETIAKLKIRGKTLCLYLNLDPNEYKTSVYHQVDVSDNKSMSGTPMMVKIKSPLGVKKAIRLIDDMLAKRNGEKRVIEERDYASMYPYETIEELIEDGLVKDVRKDK